MPWIWPSEPINPRHRLVAYRKRQDRIFNMERGIGMKVLEFNYAGTRYEVSLEKKTLGHIIRYGRHKWPLPHPSWVMLGISTHHWHRRVTIPLRPDIMAEELRGGIVWDCAYGSTRTWNGRYMGKLPRVEQPYIRKEI